MGSEVGVFGSTVLPGLIYLVLIEALQREIKLRKIGNIVLSACGYKHANFWRNIDDYGLKRSLTLSNYFQEP